MPVITDQPPTRHDPTDGWRHVPVAIVALGCSTAVDNRSMPLQAAVGRAIAWITGLRLPRRPVRPGSVRILASR